MMKKFLLLCTTGLLTACTSSAQHFEVEGLNYNVLSSDELTVEVGNNSHIGRDSITIPHSITYQGTDYSVVAIGDSAFAFTDMDADPRLQKVVVSKGIKTIGKAAFAQSYNLTSVVLPEGLTTIDEEAFSGCEALNELNFPEGLETIGDYAFRSCRFSTFTAPQSLKSIGAYAFYKKGLEKIKLNEALEEIGEFAFANNISLASFSLPKALQRIGEGAFTITGVEHVIIPETWKRIPEKAFEDCPELAHLTLCEGVEEIGAQAFASCQKLTSLTLPKSVKKVGADAFDLTSLRFITIANPETVWEKGALRVPSFNYSKLLSCQSDHPEVATVDEEGCILIHGKGIADLTLEIENAETHKRRTATCCIRVGLEDAKMGINQYLEMEGLWY